MSTTSGDKVSEVVHLDRRKLLARHLAGDKTAFPEFMETYRRLVFSYIVRSGVDTASRDDLFQEVFLKVHHAASTYQPERAIEPWLFTIAANTVRSHFRKIKVRQIVQSEAAPPEPVQTTTAHDHAERAETASWLDINLQKLPAAQREAILLCCIHNLSYQDGAKALGIPVNTLKTHVSRGRAALVKALAKRNASQKLEEFA